jgi:hypothetical protein
MFYLLRSLLCCWVQPPTLVHSSVNLATWKAAGTFFTDGLSVLAGIQSHKPDSSISGIGGKREADESYLQTALRETIEELFEFDSIPNGLLRQLQRNLIPSEIFQNGTYIYVVYSFKDLETLLQIVANYKLRSRLYYILPRTISDLILQRSQSIAAELERLVLIPIAESSSQFSTIHSDLSQDIDLYRTFHSVKV